jgi:hypothetical protein
MVRIDTSKASASSAAVIGPGRSIGSTWRRVGSGRALKTEVTSKYLVSSDRDWAEMQRPGVTAGVRSAGRSSGCRGTAALRREEVLEVD